MKISMCLADFKMGLIFAPFSKDFQGTSKKKTKLNLFSVS